MIIKCSSQEDHEGTNGGRALADVIVTIVLVLSLFNWVMNIV